MKPRARTRSQRTLSGGGDEGRGGEGVSESVLCSSMGSGGGSGGGGGETRKSSDDGPRVSSASVQMVVGEERVSSDHRKGRDGGGDVGNVGGTTEEEVSGDDSVMVIRGPKWDGRMVEIIHLDSESEDRSGEEAEDGDDSVDGGGECLEREEEGKDLEKSVEEIDVKSESEENLPEIPVRKGARETVRKIVRESSGSGEKLGSCDVPKGASTEDKKMKGGERCGEKQPLDCGEKLRPFRFENMTGVSCIAKRTRLKFGQLERVSYTVFFKDKFSDDEVYDDDGEEEEEGEEEKDGDDKNKIEDDDNYSDTMSNNGGDRLVFSLKKRKFSGTEALVSASEESGSEEALSSGSLVNPQQKYKRSQLCSEEFDRKKKEKLGTVRDADGIGVKEAESSAIPDSSSSDEDVGMKKRKRKMNTGGDSMDVDARDEEISLRMQSRKAIRRKDSWAKASAIYQLLLNSIQKEGEELSGELHCKQEERSDDGLTTNKESFPLDFFFDDEVPRSTEKSECEKMTEELWADFDFVMGLNDIGSYNVQCELENNTTAEVGADFSALCAKGKHELFLDEQIGICCRYCSFLLLEIKHVLPSWGAHPGGRSGRKNAGTKDCDSILNGFDSVVGVNGSEASFAFPTGTVWEHVPQVICKLLYQHQREAFEFMWKNLAGGIHLDESKIVAKSDDIGGCVIAHAPGTGKTRLAIVFIYSYLKVFPECRPVIVVPSSMLLAWEAEIRRLSIDLPVHNMNAAEYSGSEVENARAFRVKDCRSMRLMRIVKLFSWVKAGGVLLISYCLFNQITTEGSTNYPEISNILREKPGLLVFDEGHTPRNEHSLIWKALEKVKTEQRIILSGTLFQNNLREFYNSLRLVRPKIVDRISPKTVRICHKKFSSLDNARDVSKWDPRAGMSSGGLEALDELISMSKPFMHVYKGNILDKLPGLRNCVVYLELLPFQKSILEKLIDIRNGTFEGEHKISLVSVHPSLVTSCVSEKENSTIDIDFLGSSRLNPYEGVKTKFVMELVRLCQARNEKVLVFSQYIDPLVLIKDQLIKLFNWSEGREVLQMDGKISSKLRQSTIDVFNDIKSEAKVLLASMKACGEGISLVGASRVVLLDVVWNPSVEKQAISRAFRLGQEKCVYTYHLITPASGERVKHDRQNTKDHISKLVFSDANIVKADTSEAEEEHTCNLLSKDEILSEMVDHDKLKDMFIKVYYPQMD